MKAAFVVDCSIAIAWLFQDEATPKTAALLQGLATEAALVPAWWLIEITNALALAERKGRITPAQSDAFLADLGKPGIEDAPPPAIGMTVGLPWPEQYRCSLPPTLQQISELSSFDDHG
jgi:hypothetical protein